jgi:DNA-binding transcriptional MerR regulator
MAATLEQGFSGKRAAEIVGITYRQLDYWARTDLIRPSLADAEGSGSRRRYSYKDLLELKVIKRLLDAGIKLESIHLVIDGTSAVLVRGSELIDVVNRYQGQGVLNLLPMDGVVEELDHAVAEMFPDTEVPPGSGTEGAAQG